jgi:hypothetical protein
MLRMRRSVALRAPVVVAGLLLAAAGTAGSTGLGIDPIVLNQVRITPRK